MRSSLAADVLLSLFKDICSRLNENDGPGAEALGSTLIDAIDEVILAENDVKDRQAEGFDPNVLDRALTLQKELTVSSKPSAWR